MRRCTLLIDERDQCVYYPSSGAGGQVLAMNGIPVIEVKIYIHINKSLQILVLIIHKVCTFHFESELNLCLAWHCIGHYYESRLNLTGFGGLV